jgi:hypothetical protein
LQCFHFSQYLLYLGNSDVSVQHYPPFEFSLSKYPNVRYVIIGGVMVGATWYLGRLARGPDGNSMGSVRWSKSDIWALQLSGPSPILHRGIP